MSLSSVWGGLREQCEGFLAWWLRELRGLGDALVTPASANSAVIHLRGSVLDAQSVEGSADLQPGTRVILAIDAAQALFLEVTFPSAVVRDLKSAVALYLERELPIRAELVNVHVRVKRRDRRLRTIVVEVIVVHRQLIESLKTRFAEAKLVVTRIGACSGGELIGDFLPRRSRLEPWRFTSLDRRLSVAAGVLAVAVVAVVAAQWTYERYQVRKQLAQVEAAAAQAKALTRRYERETEPAADLVTLMARSDATDVLAALTARVPDSSWLYELEVSQQRGGSLGLKAAGFVPAATMFTDMLAKAPEFQEVRLASATSAGLGTAKDRVQLTARWGVK